MISEGGKGMADNKNQNRGLRYSLAVERAESMDDESLERQATNPDATPTEQAAARETLIDRAGS